MNKILLLLLLIPTALSAQINKSDTLKYKADLSITGFTQSGNVETFIFRAKSNMSFKAWNSWVFKTTNSYVYQEFGKQKADEDILSLNFLSFNPDRKIYPLLLGFISTNFRREIDLRTLFGVGVTFQAWSKDKSFLKFSVSGEHEQTDFNRADFNYSEYDGQHTLSTFRSTLWISGRYNLVDNKVIVTHESYVQPSLEQRNNYRWQADFGLEFPIWKFLNFKTNYVRTFESIVMQNQKQGDQFLTFGFTLKSY